MRPRAPAALHSASCSQGPSVLWRGLARHPILRLKAIPSCARATFGLFVHPLLEIWVTPPRGLLRIAPL